MLIAVFARCNVSTMRELVDATKTRQSIENTLSNPFNKQCARS